MTKTLFAFALVALIPAGVVLADDDDCSVPKGDWQSRDAVAQVAKDNGWSVRKIEVDDGCYEIEGRDRDGRRIEAELNPATLQILEVEYEDDDDRASANNPAPAGTVAPPQNGLFDGGTAPQVQVN